VNAVTKRLRLPFRDPFDGRALLDFLAARAIPGVEEYDGKTFRRTLRLTHSEGIVELGLQAGYVDCVLQLEDFRDEPVAVERARRLLDLDADSIAIDDVLRGDPMLRPLVQRAPGRRVPGSADGFELAARAILGQQVSVKGARTLAGRIVKAFGKPLDSSSGTLTHTFPTPDVLAGADLTGVGLTGARRATISNLARAVAAGDLTIDFSSDPTSAVDALQSIPGIGPWTASYVALRALGDPDAFMPTDLGVRKAFELLGIRSDYETVAERWRPWRGYAMQHLWATLAA
jgi:AraC family transcriptional regulator, regulatory protein of adaptative response / DNA-3-methyladenine glycosylase II